MKSFRSLTIDRQGCVFIITLNIPPENRLNLAACREVTEAFHEIQRELGPSTEGAVITRGSGTKYWCTGLDLYEADENPYANSDGFFPMLATILDFPYPTVALITGHTIGGACLFALAHDYRVMNSQRGYFYMPPIILGLHFQGIGALPRLKLAPHVARKLLMQAHKFTATQAQQDGIVDEAVAPDQMFEAALAIARKWAHTAKQNVYTLIREELYGDAVSKFKLISHVHGRMTSRPAGIKL
ncbi:hypothetical protein B0A52_01404 [Exophiala mesophila]|uniref:Enoyl-CoA hydratase n=1 Tax=Exophiala mesophila TaxID=212818 RepID=A0A438NHD2_EXOME|nr:hypothetical protein B0A52_01404 [Exophiala mesophila]